MSRMKLRLCSFSHLGAMISEKNWGEGVSQETQPCSVAGSPCTPCHLPRARLTTDHAQALCAPEARNRTGGNTGNSKENPCRRRVEYPTRTARLAVNGPAA